jgi:hypothetical protein
MAKYVLLAFDNDEDADQFIAFTNQYKVTLIGPQYDATELPTALRAVYKKPTKFCEGAGCTQSGKGRPGFTRGTKYGWWVCANCKKPARPWAEGSMWYTALGLNLLPVSEEAPEYRGPGLPGYKPPELDRLIEAEVRSRPYPKEGK